MNFIKCRVNLIKQLVRHCRPPFPEFMAVELPEYESRDGIRRSAGRIRSADGRNLGVLAGVCGGFAIRRNRNCYSTVRP